MCCGKTAVGRGKEVIAEKKDRPWGSAVLPPYSNDTNKGYSSE
jgi:hypothetical protein